jgi:long-chain fatty acid transport protein
VRAGYVFQQSPVPDSTLEPGNPDANQHNLTLGLGYRTGRVTLDGFYMIGIYRGRTVDNAVLPGTYDNSVHYFGISVGYAF